MTVAPRRSRRRAWSRWHSPPAGASRSASFGWLLALSLAGCADRELTIAQVQGTGAMSPRLGETVTVTGVVTGVLDDGAFFLQSTRGDRSRRTSDGVLVRRENRDEAPSSSEAPSPGDLVRVRALVREEQRSGSELPTTVLVIAAAAAGAGDGVAQPMTVLDRGRKLPAARPAPNADALDGARPALAAWEALEGMLVELGPVTVVGPAGSFGEVAVIPDRAATRAPRSARGGLLDADPARPRFEVVLLDDALAQLGALADASVGDRVEHPLVGVASYRFGAHRVHLLETPSHLVASSIPFESAQAPADGELTVATLNVENLDLGDPPSRFRALADFVRERLGSPDLLLLQEVQDDSGPVDDGETSSDDTLRRLVGAIRSDGGPIYSFRYVRPADGADGGEPGGNIRTVLLLRRRPGLAVVDLPPLAGNGSEHDAAAQVRWGLDGLELRPSPARVAPRHPAFEGSRKPLAVELRVDGTPLWLVGIHLASKRPDDPLAGTRQPPHRRSSVQRAAQARQVAELARAILEIDPSAWLLVLGDCNDGLRSSATAELERVGLVDLMTSVPEPQRYTYVFQGRSQLLDHVLASPALAACCSPAVEVVHGNADSPAAERISDHDSVVARFRVVAGK